MWALAMLLPGLAAIALMPLVLYWLFPPEIKSTPDAANSRSGNSPNSARCSAARRSCWACSPAAVAVGRCAGDDLRRWLGGGRHHAAFIGLGVLLLSGVLDWDDVLKEKSAWDTIVWFSALVMMATFLNKLGLITWFSKAIENGILGLAWVGSAPCVAVAGLPVCALFVRQHHGAHHGHVRRLLWAGIALGAPALPFALLMAAASTS